LVDPQHEIAPEDLLHFFQLAEFADDWKALGFDLEDDLSALEVSIMSNPQIGKVISWNRGVVKT
jgi:hypothetical protein